MMHRTTRIAVWVAVAGAGLLAAHARLVRPWALRWGATTEEAARPLPGDELVTKADYIATRAITIEAPPRDVWPWLVQIGSGRAGWYTYDRIDNAGVPSATEIIPELQRLAVGDLIPMVAGKDIGSGSRSWSQSAGCCGGTSGASTAGNGCWSRPMAEPG